MFFASLFAAISLIDLAVGIFLIILMCSAVAFDRRRQSYWRWPVLLLLVGTGITFSGLTFDEKTWKDTLFGLFDNSTLITGVGVYLGLGILYSVAEFAMTVRRTAVRLKEAWTTHIAGRETVGDTPSTRVSMQRRELYDDADKNGTESKYVDTVRSMNTNFVNQNGFYREVITIEANRDTLKVEPIVNRRRLPAAVGDWVTFWPFFLLNFLLYDLLSEVWNAIATFLATYGQRFVKAVFTDVFTLRD